MIQLLPPTPAPHASAASGPDARAGRFTGSAARAAVPFVDALAAASRPRREASSRPATPANDASRAAASRRDDRQAPRANTQQSPTDPSPTASAAPPTDAPRQAPSEGSPEAPPEASPDASADAPAAPMPDSDAAAASIAAGASTPQAAADARSVAAQAAATAESALAQAALHPAGSSNGHAGADGNPQQPDAQAQPATPFAADADAAEPAPSLVRSIASTLQATQGESAGNAATQSAATPSAASPSLAITARDAAAPAAPAQALPTPNDDPSASLNTARVARGLQNAIQQNGGSVTLRLTPADMGTVRIQMQIQGANVSASFMTETESARSMLSQTLSQLRTALESQGLSVDRLHVQTMPSGQSAQSGQGGGSSGGGASGGQGQAHASDQHTPDGRSRGFMEQHQQGGDPRQRNGRDAAPAAFEDLLTPNA